MSVPLLIASHNEGKIREFRAALATLSAPVLSLADVHITSVVEETGKSFKDNAILKAEEYGRIARVVCLADDSGLEIDALNGEPGPQSARYAGIQATDAERVELVLKKMRGIPGPLRSARFVCVIAISAPGRPTRAVERHVCGLITREPHGDRGFGYDPIFFYPPAGRTFAEMTSIEKNAVSHRALALQAAIPLIADLVQAGILG